jgi:hypothetical protein
MNGNDISTFLETLHTYQSQLSIYYCTQIYELRFEIYLQEQIALNFTLCHVTPVVLVQTEQLFDCVYYLTKHVNLKGWVKMVDSFVYHTINEFPKWDLPALILHTMAHFPHITAYFSENLDTSLQECLHWQLLFQYTDHLLMNIYSWFKQQMFFLSTLRTSRQFIGFWFLYVRTGIQLFGFWGTLCFKALYIALAFWFCSLYVPNGLSSCQ